MSKSPKYIVLASLLSLLSTWSAIAQLPSAEPSTSPSLVSPITKVDYAPLQKLLSTGQWREANEKTGQLILQATNRSAPGWVRSDDIAVFPCWDLQTIDTLWKQASNDRFGFSAQFPIYIAAGNKPGRLVATDSYDTFGDRVGWRIPSNNPNKPKESDWIVFKENLNFSLEAPVGHLPNPRQEYQVTGGRLLYTALTKRLVECKVVTLPSSSSSISPSTTLSPSLPAFLPASPSGSTKPVKF
jgi:hypothetical protein